jgi:DNA ligase-1
VTLPPAGNMASPAKRRKKNDSKPSPASSRSLDYFFGKQNKDLPVRPTTGTESPLSGESEISSLTDEQLARKLQAEWDKEEAGSSTTQTVINTAPSSRTVFENEDQETENLKGDFRFDEARKHTREDSPELKIENFDQNIVDTTFIDTTSLDVKYKNTLSLQSTGSAEDHISATIPFDESPLIFDPQKYIPDLQKHWAIEGGDASYSLLIRCFILISSTQSRIKIVDTLVNYLRTIIEGDPSSLTPTVRIQ